MILAYYYGREIYPECRALDPDDGWGFEKRCRGRRKTDSLPTGWWRWYASQEALMERANWNRPSFCVRPALGNAGVPASIGP